MNHLWIAYDTLLVFMGLVNLVLLVLARARKHFLPPFAVFYAAFTAAMFVALSRRYVSFNVAGAHEQVAYLAYGLVTCLNYLVLAACVVGFQRMLGMTHPLRTRFICSTLAAAALLDISPLSVISPGHGQVYTLGTAHYAAVAVFLSAFTYVLWLAARCAQHVEDPSDRRFAFGLLLFAAVGYVESWLGVASDLRSGSDELGAAGEEFLYSSIPYALFSVALAAYLQPLISTAPPGDLRIDTAKAASLNLSTRESEVLALLFRGWSNKRIANALNLSEATVKTHLNKIFRKAQVSSRFELVRGLASSAQESAQAH